mmetsp:Transcript_44300/g.82279  ORF Transcript_44300/g.82279 Transcript_44300/m.82279 type:complete len:95 (+) Transcript_44300:2-286(+)
MMDVRMSMSALVFRRPCLFISAMVSSSVGAVYQIRTGSLSSLAHGCAIKFPEVRYSLYLIYAGLVCSSQSLSHSTISQQLQIKKKKRLQGGAGM